MLKPNASRRDFVFVLCAAISWGTTGVASQAIYASSATNPLSLAALRLAIATPLFLFASWRLLGWRLWQIKPRHLSIMLLMGGLQALYQASFFAAIPYTGVTVATLLALCVAPVLVALFSAIVMHERLKPIVLLALIGALAGTILLVLGRVQPTGHEQVSWPGVILALISASGYASLILCGRFISTSYHPLQINTVAFGTGTLLLLCLTPFTGLVLTYPTWDWLLFLYLGAIPTALAYTLFQAGLRSLSATITSIVTLCEPCTAALLAWILFHEALSPSGLLGAVLLPGSMIVILLLGGK
jgi:DME family drug/metabolite transporter